MCVAYDPSLISDTIDRRLQNPTLLCVTSAHGTECKRSFNRGLLMNVNMDFRTDCSTDKIMLLTLNDCLVVGIRRPHFQAMCSTACVLYRKCRNSELKSQNSA
jgi:hypothetical protein